MDSKFVTLPRLSRFLENLKNLFVQKDGSKVLSDNNYTTAEKEKLAGITSGANKYTLPTASGTVLGGVKIGNNMSIDSNGAISPVLTSKVDKVEGKGLSTNDYTTAEKTKLAGIASAANKYVLPTASATELGGIKVGANLTITNGVLSADQRKIDLTPYAKTADVASTYETKSDATAKQTALNNAIALKANASDLAAYAKKSDVASAVIYKGTVANYSDLPSTGMAVGWMYNITNADEANGVAAGDNLVYNGKGWDNYRGTIVIDEASDTDIDGLFTV